MIATRRMALAAAAIVASGAGVYLGLTHMGWFSSHHEDLRKLLGPHGEALAGDGTQLATWVPDANYKPRGYYVIQPVDEKGFRQMALKAGLSVSASTGAEAVWRLPDGVVLPGWAAPGVPAAEGLQASGTVGGAAVWARWYRGNAYIAATVSAP